MTSAFFENEIPFFFYFLPMMTEFIFGCTNWFVFFGGGIGWVGKEVYKKRKGVEEQKDRKKKNKNKET